MSETLKDLMESSDYPSRLTEADKARDKLVQMIEGNVRQFTKDTGVSVTDIDLGATEVTCISDASNHYVYNFKISLDI